MSKKTSPQQEKYFNYELKELSITEVIKKLQNGKNTY